MFVLTWALSEPAFINTNYDTVHKLPLRIKPSVNSDSHRLYMMNKLLFLVSFDTKPTKLSKLDQPCVLKWKGVSVSAWVCVCVCVHVQPSVSVFSLALVCVKSCYKFDFHTY